MPISINLPNDVETRLNKLCEKTGRNRNYIVTQAVLEQLDDIEDEYLATNRMKSILAGRIVTESLADVAKKKGL